MRQFYLILFNFNYMKISLKSRWNPARLLLYVQARFITTRGFDEAIHPSGSVNYSKETSALFVLQLLLNQSESKEILQCRAN